MHGVRARTGHDVLANCEDLLTITSTVLHQMGIDPALQHWHVWVCMASSLPVSDAAGSLRSLYTTGEAHS